MGLHKCIVHAVLYRHVTVGITILAVVLIWVGNLTFHAEGVFKNEVVERIFGLERKSQKVYKRCSEGLSDLYCSL